MKATMQEILNILTGPNRQNKLGGGLPSYALRFLIFEHLETGEYLWYFGRGQSDHAQLEEEFQKEWTDVWHTTGGGFYSRCMSDKVRDGVRIEVIKIFGKSGTFGLDIDTLKKALPILRNSLNKFTDIELEYDGKE